MRQLQLQQQKFSGQRSSTQTSPQPIPPGWHVAKHTRTHGACPGHCSMWSVAMCVYGLNSHTGAWYSSSSLENSLDAGAAWCMH
jgi:hypothetical protein